MYLKAQMKLCIGFGNCQTQALKICLEKFTNFSETYEMITFANWEMINQDKREPINENSSLFLEYVKKADLIIVQPLGDQYGCYSTNPENPDSFRQLIKPECRVLSFPRMYNSALFPLFHKKHNSNVFVGRIKNMPEVFEEFLQAYDEGKLDFDLPARLLENYEIAKEKEKTMDCKMADFIYELIPKRQVFLTQDHVTTICYIELTRQISELLGITMDLPRALKIADENDNYINQIDSTYQREEYRYPISDYARKALNLSWAPPESEETRAFYKSILKHYFLSRVTDVVSYPFISTVPTGVIYKDVIWELFATYGLISCMQS